MQQNRPGDFPSDMAPEPASSFDTGKNVERMRYIEHAGKRILLVDLRGCTAEQLLKFTEAVPQYVTSQPKNSVFLLGDFRDTEFNRETIEHLKIAVAFDRSYIAKSAWVLSDQSGRVKVLLDSIRSFSGRDIVVFATREEALDYLVS